MGKIIGYTTGVFDLFHVGHLNIIRNAKANCDELIVGVSTDELVRSLKGRDPIIPFEERADIVASIKAVDRVYPEKVNDKLLAWEELRFDVIFKGDDWKGSERWKALELAFDERGVRVVYFPYTANTSSSKIRRIVEEY